MNIVFALKKGNSSKYDPDKLEADLNSPLKDKSICFLGSSVTRGYGSMDVSFVELLAKECSLTYIKEAVNGTTLVNDKEDSYVNRLYSIDKNLHFNAFVVQLSTNDASKNKEFGDYKSNDDHTIAGAINTIIDYVRSNYNCPILFYTNPDYQNERYEKMVELLLQISKERNIYVLELYHDEKFNAEIKRKKNLYMSDDIHPTKAGYHLISKKMKDVLIEMIKG